MKRFTDICLLIAATLLFLLVGCGTEEVEPKEVVVTQVVEKEVVVTEIVVLEGEERIVAVTRVVSEEVVVVTPAPQPAHESSDSDGSPAGAADLNIATSNRLQQQRLIIKNGEITIGMINSSAAVNNVVQIAVDYGGYIISQRVWQRTGYTYATITMGVPVTEFENAMRRLRTMSDEVRDETASGSDVSDEYVDLNSKLVNLQATRDRIRTFLDQAETVEESLEVNDQLSEIEGQIAEIQGRINYLAGRAAYSTITVQVEPIIPTRTPSPTPTVTPTPTNTPTLTPTPTSTHTPTATPKVWRAGKTVERASSQLSDILVGLANFAIYNGIVCGPFIVVMALGAWIAYRVWLRFFDQAQS